MPRRCELSIVNHATAKPAIDLKRLQGVLDAALAEEGIAASALSVMLVDDAESAALHRQHFGEDDPTDVMSFPDGSTDPESGARLLGDLAVGVEVAARAAAERGRPVADELTLYILHGLLHLLGYDDEEEGDAREMWQAQRRLLALSGIVIEDEPTP